MDANLSNLSQSLSSVRVRAGQETKHVIYLLHASFSVKIRKKTFHRA